MSSYRRERIELNAPTTLADKFEGMLKENLHARAKLKRVEDGKQVIFSFYPTKGEYFLVAINTMCICKELGGKQK